MRREGKEERKGIEEYKGGMHYCLTYANCGMRSNRYSVKISWGM